MAVVSDEVTEETPRTTRSAPKRRRGSRITRPPPLLRATRTPGGASWPTRGSPASPGPPSTAGAAARRRQQAIFDEEMARYARARRCRLGIGMGMVGADDPRPRHRRAEGALPAADRSGPRTMWCQLFSEPGAGSDLAGADDPSRARRRRVGGQRPEGVDLGARARTPTTGCCWPAPTPTQPKHQGITYFAARHAPAGRRGAAAAADDRRRRVQRGVPHRRARARTTNVLGEVERRLGGGHDHARQRTGDDGRRHRGAQAAARTTTRTWRSSWAPAG